VEPKGGDKVFDRTKDAVHKLDDLLRDKKSQIPDATVQTWIDLIVSVARTVAEVEIADAAAAGGDAHQIADAARELDKAADELARGHVDQAIDHYKHAWKHAEDALKHTAVL
jgi:ElaB/YqjD/DUF883 family membrane-anchored ribosome-binding protein